MHVNYPNLKRSELPGSSTVAPYHGRQVVLHCVCGLTTSEEAGFGLFHPYHIVRCSGEAEHPQTFVFNIDRRIDITVVMRPAYGAGPLTYLQVLYPRVLSPTARAYLAGRESPVYFHKQLSPFRHLVFQHVPEHPETVVHGGFSEFQGAGYGFHVEVFHAYDIVPLGYRSTLLMQEVLSLICGMPGYLCDCKSLFLMAF